MWNASCSRESALTPSEEILENSVAELFGQGGLRSCRAGRFFHGTAPGSASFGGLDGPRVRTMPSTTPTIASATTTAAIGQKNGMPSCARVEADAAGFLEDPVRRL